MPLDEIIVPTDNGISSGRRLAAIPSHLRRVRP
jgi:hypothetical protein